MGPTDTETARSGAPHKAHTISESSRRPRRRGYMTHKMRERAPCRRKTRTSNRITVLWLLM